MDAALKSMRPAVRDPLLVIAVTPVIPHILGSVFNIWYNLEIVDPLLRAAGLRERFISTVIVWNAFAFPVAVFIWLRLVFSLRPVFRQLLRDEIIPAEELDAARRRLVNLPWSWNASWNVSTLRACNAARSRSASASASTLVG